MSPDVIDVPLPLAGEDGEVLPPNTCPECAAEGIVKTSTTFAGLQNHRSRTHGILGVHTKKEKPKKGSAAPGITLNVNSGKSTKASKDADRLAKTAKGAASFANMAAAGLTFVNQPEDAGIVAANAEAFGAAVGELAQYQPWLSTVFAPGGEMTGEVAAWLGLVAVCGAIVVPIGARHGWIPERYAAAFGVAASASTMAGAPAAAHTIADAMAADGQHAA